MPSLIWGQSIPQDNLEYVHYITTKFKFLEDPDGTILPSSILNGTHDKSFKSIDSDNFFAGITKSTFWFKINHSELAKEVNLIEINEPYLTAVSLFWKNAAGNIDSKQNGMLVPYENRSIQSGRIAFELSKEMQNKSIYICVQANAPISFSIIAYSNESWKNSLKDYQIILIIFITLFILVSIASILLAFMRRQDLFLYYLGFVICLGTAVLHNFGFAKEIIELPHSHQIVPTCISFSLCFLLGIYGALLSMSEEPYPILRKYLKIGMGLFLFIGLLYQLVPMMWMIHVVVISFLVLLISLIILSIKIGKIAGKGIRIFTINCILLLFASIAHFFSIFGIATIPVSIKLFPLFYLIVTMVFFLLGFVYQSNIHQKALIITEQSLKNSLSELEFYRQKLMAHMPTSNTVDIRNEIQIFEAKPKMEVTDLNQLLLTPLSERELAVLRLIAKGNSNNEVADVLFISINTVKTHLSRIYGKLDVNNRTEAAIRAGEMNLLKSH